MNSSIDFASVSLSDIIGDLTREGFFIYCGAGISIPAPTCAPSWWVLTEEILKGFFNTIPKEWGLPNDLIIKDPDIKPEEVFETFAYVFDELLYDVFKALDFGSFNANHQLIARLASSRKLKACFTTNFDTFIEKALNAEGVEFELIIDNGEFENLLSKLNSEGIGNKFILCKVHGTTERPKTIVSVASAYKSSKGFSTPKADVLTWLLNRYPCLFLGYSGWDFEHLNYRRFWERAGKNLKQIYWNRKPGETDGPVFSEIFHACIDRFTFCEADLPDGMVSALNQSSIPNLNLNELNLLKPSENEQFWGKNKNARMQFFGDWSDSLPTAHKLAAAMTEGELLSARFKEKQKQLIESSKSQTSYTGPDPHLQQELQELSIQLSTQQISLEDYTKKSFEIQLKMQLGPVREEYRPYITSIFLDDKFPGFTDDSLKQQQLLPKIIALLDRFEPERAVELAIEIMKKDEEATLKGEPHTTADMTLNLMYQSIISPNDEEWQPYYEKMLVEKEKYLQGDIDLNTFKASLMAILNESKETQLGVTIPVDALLNRLMEVFVAGSKNVEEFKINLEAFNLAANYRYAYINSIMYKTSEYKKIESICHEQTVPIDQSASAPKISPEAEKQLIELGLKYSQGKITLDDYQKQAIAISMGNIQTQPQTGPNPSEEMPIVPNNLLEEYDKRIRDWMRPVLDAQYEFFGDELNETRILIEMTIFGIWIAGTQYLDIKSGTKVQQLQNQGLYPKVISNPSVTNYLWKKNEEWIKKAIKELPNKFMQRLCFYLITFSEMTNDFQLCREITERSLELTEGVINETVYHNIPICLASFYHEQGDLENALKYYSLALDGVKMFVPSVWSDVAIYQAAQMNAQKGNIEEALRIIGTYHSEYKGNLPPYAPPARKLCLEFAEHLAIQLGYKNAREAIGSLI